MRNVKSRPLIHCRFSLQVECAVCSVHLLTLTLALAERGAFVEVMRLFDCTFYKVRNGG